MFTHDQPAAHDVSCHSLIGKSMELSSIKIANMLQIMLVTVDLSTRLLFKKDSLDFSSRYIYI